MAPDLTAVESAISVKDLSKKYRRFANTADTLKELLHPFGKKYHDEFWALKGVSFEVKKGETIGLIGRNGSGKSTLLQVLCGILQPTSGTVRVSGRVAALLELGAGFSPDFSGRENVYMNGALMGLSRQEMDDRFSLIAEFAEIGDFMEQPVKTYSSGMYVRLAFAVAINVDPDILIVDEALAVGDARFQLKCYRKIAKFKEDGKAIIFVTHDASAVLRHADTAILIGDGKVLCKGTPKKVVNEYFTLLCDGDSVKQQPNIDKADLKKMLNNGAYGAGAVDNQEDHCPQKKNYNPYEFRYGTGEARIVDFELIDNGGREVIQVRSGDTIALRVKVRFFSEVLKPTFGIHVNTKDGLLIYGKNTQNENIEVKPQVEGSWIWFESSMKVNLLGGEYFISAGIGTLGGDSVQPLDRRYDLIHLTVLPSDNSSGMVNLEADILISYFQQV